MNRDRDRRRDMHVPPEDQYMNSRGQSYRPGNVRASDSYRARSPPRRPDYTDSYKADTYAPRPRTRSPPPRRIDDYRRRSPSPARYQDSRDFRGGDSYRGRPRSPPPPRREELPRDDLFRRDVGRDDRDYRDSRDYRDDRARPYMAAHPVARSPLPRYRDRSTVPLKRVREPSPVSSRGRRTPPPAKRERLGSPPRSARYDEYPPSRAISPPRRGYSPGPRDRRPSPSRGPTRDYHPRSRSPYGRNDRVDPRAVDDWRRPRSPVRESRQEHLREESGVNSAATSRRSSPPVHPSRAALQQPTLDDRPRSSKASPRDAYDAREPYRAPEPEPRATPTRERGYDDDRGHAVTREPIPPPREPRREDDVPAARVPPTGPSAQRSVSTMAPPTGPAAVTTPSGPRAAGAPPSGPRGAPPASRGDFSGRGRGAFSTDFAPRGRGSFSTSFRGSRGGAAAPALGLGRGEVAAARSESSGQSADFGARAPPSGPRSSFSQAPSPAFRQTSSSSSAAFQRPQRFDSDPVMPNVPTGPKAARRPTEPALNSALAQRVHPALADLPKIIDGGQKAEPLIDRTKLDKLEEEAEKLRKQIEEKEARKRKTLRDWDRLNRETEVAALRSELAEQALKQLNGEAESQAAF